MKPIRTPLNPGDRSDEVVNLQDSLLFLLAKLDGMVPPNELDRISRRITEEQREGLYGDLTTLAVRAFQEHFHQEFNLEPHGKVDDRTADALNRVLERSGAFQPAPIPQRVVHGTVQRGNQPFANGIVRAFHVSGNETVFLGEHKLADGNYRIIYPASAVNGPVNLVVRLVDEFGSTLVEKDPIPSAQPDETVNLDVPEDNGGSEDGKGTVKGRIFLSYGVPAAGVKVELVNRAFGEDPKELKPITPPVEIGADGSYTLAYPLNGVANLQVRAIDAAGKPVDISGVKYNAKEQVELNLIAPAEVKPLEPEYKRLAADLGKQVGDISNLAKAQETNTRQDLTLLHKATGWDARLIGLAATANQLTVAEETGVSAEALYALYRVGLPMDKQALANVNVEAFESALQVGTDSGIIGLNKDEIATAKKAFGNFVADNRFKTTTPGAPSSLGEILKTARGTDDSALTEDEQKAFAQLYLSHRGSPQELWTEAAKILGANSDKKIDGLRLQGKLNYLTFNNAVLTESLQKEVKTPGNIAALADLELYKPKEWERRIKELANNEGALGKLIPPAYPGDKVAERLDAYTTDLARTVRINFPTRVVTHMLERDEINLNGIEHETKTPTVTFLKKAEARGFLFSSTPMETFSAENADLLKEMDPLEREQAIKGAKTLQRLYQITPSDEALQVLAAQGFTSAQDIVAYTEAQFIDRFADKFPTPEQAKQVHEKATQVSLFSYNFYTITEGLARQPEIFVISPGSTKRQETKDDLIKRFPTLEGLFGSLDFCECEHCNSVLSPAAYFVDLLQFVNPTDQEWINFTTRWKEDHQAEYPYPNKAEEDAAKAAGNLIAAKKPYDLLIDRRPDLPHLPLTCENTNTALPYIDLVNEILEYSVANNQLDAGAAQDTGAATTPELLAEPQNVNDGAYAKTIEARYPLSLPFDYWLEAIRRFFDHFEMPLWQVLERFRATDRLELFTDANNYPYYRAQIFAEYLGISPAEYARFTDANPLSEWHWLYGYYDSKKTLDENKITADPDKKTALKELKSAKSLSRRLGITYKELVELTQTWFVNPELKSFGLLEKLQVEPADVIFYQEHKDLLPKDETKLSSTERKDLKEVKAFVQRLTNLNKTFDGLVDVRKELDDALVAGTLDKVLLLVDSDPGCNFDATTLVRVDHRDEYIAGQDVYDKNADVYALVLTKLNLFVRLWRKLGWSIAETDRALEVLIPKNSKPLTDSNLGNALRTALIYLAHLKRLDGELNVGKSSRFKLLSLWSNLPTTGKDSLYARLLLTPTVLKNDPVFDHPLGNYLTAAGISSAAEKTRFTAVEANVDPAKKLDPAAFAGDPAIKVSYDFVRQEQTLSYLGILDDAKEQALNAVPSDVLKSLLDKVQIQAKQFDLVRAHLVALQSALNLTADEIERILKDDKQDLASAKLSLDSVSLLYRYGLLSRGLGMSVRDLIALKELSGHNPFKSLDPDPLTKLNNDYPLTETLRFIEIAALVKDSGLQAEDWDYILRHRFDPIGKYRDDPSKWLTLLKTLASEMERIQAGQSSAEGVTDDVVRQKLGIILDADLAARFVQATANNLQVQVGKEKVKPEDKINPTLFATAQEIGTFYNPAKELQQLTLRGMLSEDRKQALQQLAPSQILKDLLDSAQSMAFQAFADNMETVLGLLTNTTEFLALKNGVTDAQKLDPTKFKNESLLRVTYDPTSQTQRLYFRGLLTAKKKADLEGGAPPQLLKDLLTDVQTQALSAAVPLVRAVVVMLMDTVEFEAIKPNVPDAEQLDAAKVEGEPRLRAIYEVDDITLAAPLVGTQRLVLRGWLSDTKKADLKTRFPGAIFGELIDGAQTKANAFLNRLRIGMLKATDWDSVFTDLDTLDKEPLDRRANLAQAILPFLLAKLNRQVIVSSVASGLAADPILIEALLTNSELLTDSSQAGEPLLNAISSAVQQGLTATYTDIGNTNRSMSITSADTAMLNNADTKQPIHIEGYFEVPANGAFRFFATLEKTGARVELRLEGLAEPIIVATAVKENDEFSRFVELTAGVPYHVYLDLPDLKGGSANLEILGEGLTRGTIGRLRLYPQTAIERVRRAHVLLSKTLQLIQGLGLSAREAQYLLQSSDFNLALAKLPTQESEDPTKTEPDLFEQFLRLATYDELKQDLAGGGDDLITIMENARCTSTVIAEAGKAITAHVTPFANLARREAGVVEETLKVLGFSPVVTPTAAGLHLEAVALADERGMKRLWDAMQVIEQFGVPAEVLTSWLNIVDGNKTPAQRAEIARDLKRTVKARYDTETWQRFAPTVFDPLRQQQRDALVGFVLHRERYERIEQLFEHFLIDAAMEPVVQTSRLALAIASVQLFIQRTLLNLEKGIHPSAINSPHWSWMQRYRVWEANRKIFLYPENWLEPEFRDDKTHLFKELEGTLLQGDVSSDLVEDAFFKYLQDLEPFARLEIVTSFLQDFAGSMESNILHVIGRTSNTPHQYFYRQYAQNMWTPWEPVPLEIDGDHVTLARWRDRIHLFWVSFIETDQKPPIGKSSSTDKMMAYYVGGAPPKDQKLTELTFGQVNSAMGGLVPGKNIQVQLNWSDYFQGTWSDRRSSSFSDPIPVTSDFTRQSERIRVSKDPFTEAGSEGAVRVHLDGKINKAFRLVSRNSEPRLLDSTATPTSRYSASKGIAASQYAGEGTLSITYQKEIKTYDDKTKGNIPPATESILGAGESSDNGYRLVPCANAFRLISKEGTDIGSFVSPIFYQNSQHTLYVEPNLLEKKLRDYEEYTVTTPPTGGVWIDPNRFRELVPIPQIPFDPHGPLVSFHPKTLSGDRSASGTEIQAK